MFPTFRVWLAGLVLAICVTCSVCVAAPSGWICGPSGCRPAPKAAPTVRKFRMVERREIRPLSRLRARLQAVRSRFWN